MTNTYSDKVVTVSELEGFQVIKPIIDIVYFLVFAIIIIPNWLFGQVGSEFKFMSPTADQITFFLLFAFLSTFVDALISTPSHSVDIKSTISTITSQSIRLTSMLSPISIIFAISAAVSIIGMINGGTFFLLIILDLIYITIFVLIYYWSISRIETSANMSRRYFKYQLGSYFVFVVSIFILLGLSNLFPGIGTGLVNIIITIFGFYVVFLTVLFTQQEQQQADLQQFYMYSDQLQRTGKSTSLLERTDSLIEVKHNLSILLYLLTVISIPVIIGISTLANDLFFHLEDPITFSANMIVNLIVGIVFYVLVGGIFILIIIKVYQIRNIIVNQMKDLTNQLVAFEHNQQDLLDLIGDN